jgi:pimeloyl-ACP methyl ester carboxylesterase
MLVHRKHPEAKLVLAGHSIGAWITLNVLATLSPVGEEKEEEDTEAEVLMKKKKIITHVLLLCPVIQDIASTPKATRFSKCAVLPVIRTLFAWSVGLVGFYMPMKIARLLTTCVSRGIPHRRAPDYYRIVPRLLNFGLFHNVLRLTHDEFKTVQKLDCLLESALRRWAKNVLFFFASTDGWVMPSIPSEFQIKFPEATFIHDTSSIEHAFTIQHSIEMASKVCKWLATTTITSEHYSDDSTACREQ